MADSSHFFSELLDFNNLNRLEPRAGRILVSEPFMPDHHFSRSVVILGDHNEEGTFGFVLNHYLEIGIHEIMQDFPEFDTRIARGGPVKTNNLYYIHTLGGKINGSLKIMDGLYMGGSFEDVQRGIFSGEISRAEIRFFLGYAGWSHGQLESELKENAWIVSKTTVAEVMDTSLDQVWENVLTRLGGKFKVISNFPEDPRLN